METLKRILGFHCLLWYKVAIAFQLLRNCRDCHTVVSSMYQDSPARLSPDDSSNCADWLIGLPGTLSRDAVTRALSTWIREKLHRVITPLFGAPKLSVHTLLVCGDDRRSTPRSRNPSSVLKAPLCSRCRIPLAWISNRIHTHYSFSRWEFATTLLRGLEGILPRPG